MTREEINKFLTVELFGECWHDWQNEDQWQFVCSLCHQVKKLDSYAWPNYFTWEGAGKVILAMRAKDCRFKCEEVKMPDWSYLVTFYRFTKPPFVAENVGLFTNFPEAVARAAVELLKGEKR